MKDNKIISATITLSGYPNMVNTLHIEKDKDGADVYLRGRHLNKKFDKYSYFHISMSERSKTYIFNKLIEKFHIDKWKNSYMDYDVCDGLQWGVIIKYTDETYKKIMGSNAFPDEWDELMKMFNRYIDKAVETEGHICTTKEVVNSVFITQ